MELTTYIKSFKDTRLTVFLSLGAMISFSIAWSSLTGFLISLALFMLSMFISGQLWSAVSTLLSFLHNRSSGRVFLVRGPEEAASLLMDHKFKYKYIPFSYSSLPTDVKWALPAGYNYSKDYFWRIVGSKKDCVLVIRNNSSDMADTREGPEYPFLALRWDSSETEDVADVYASEIFNEVKGYKNNESE